MIPPRIKEIRALDDFYIEITYVTGERRLYNMKENLKYDFYKKLKNIEYFKLAKSAETTIEWPNGEDTNPNELYENSIKVK